MSDHHRTQIHERLITEKTDTLLEIWHQRYITKLQEDVFVIVGEILTERLGEKPPEPAVLQVAGILHHPEPSAALVSLLEEAYEASPARMYLEQAFEFADDGQVEKALEACEAAKAVMPEYAGAYEELGVVYSVLDRFGPAYAAYSKAIRLGSNQMGIWKDFLLVEAALKDEFEGLPAKRHLDRALEYAEDEEIHRALEEIEMAKTSLPEIAPTYNYLGLIFQTLRQYEPAIDAYLQAIRCNPRYSPARQNLRSARIAWEAEQYHLAARTQMEEEAGDPLLEWEDPELIEKAEDVGWTPGWIYMDETTCWLRGWPGFRNRPGRIGLDPLDAYFEEPHTYGIILRQLWQRKLRTRNPMYLIMMAGSGMMFNLPLLFMIPLLQDPDFVIFTLLMFILLLPSCIGGALLLLNVVLSLLTEPPEENTSPFY